MGITEKEFEKLLHDLKRIGQVIQIIVDEENTDKRKLTGCLLQNEFDRLYDDIDELRPKKIDNKN